MKRIVTILLVLLIVTVVISLAWADEQNETEDVTKVPLFGDLPVVGNLFKNRNKTSNKSELLIFITPRTIGERGVAR